MSALYFHIPFCKRICGYCDFRRYADLRPMSRTFAAMHDELDETVGFLHDTAIRSIYFGGGTPSLAAPAELQRLADHAARLYDCTQVGEMTVEVNPDDITPAYIRELRTTAVDRISIGIQSFDNRVLRFMNRRHTAAQARNAVLALQDAGYCNLTVDIIFGLGDFGDEVLLRDLEEIAALNVQHVSAYHLTIEPATRFGRMAERGELSPIDEERSGRQFELIHDALTASGFDHYEVSNYAREGFRARHNSAYWDGTEYLGIGTGAHSFNGSVRRWCEQTPAEYAAARRYGSERLSRRDRLNETVMTSLRRAEGLDLKAVERDFGADEAARLARAARPLAEGFGAVCTEGVIRIPPRRMLTSDAVIGALFAPEQAPEDEIKKY